METTPYDPAHDDATRWLFGRVNYERAAVIPYGEEALKLDRVRELLRGLGEPQRDAPIVHVAGTKGKGSTCAMIAAALEAAGLRTGVYASPHLDRVEERFAVSGGACTRDEFIGLVESVRAVAERMDRQGGDGPTFFDLTTAMALLHFARRGVGAVVLEVGLGGRLDSTNVVTPAVSVVTSISLDHTRQLGATRALIAAEKAAIFKPGVPAVSGVADAEAGDVIQRTADGVGAPLSRRGRDFTIARNKDAWDFTRQTAARGTEELRGVRTSLPGVAQGDNAAVALATLGVLADAGWAIPAEARLRGVATGRLPGRLELFPGEPLVVVDGAHNDASAAALADALDALCGDTPRDRRVLVAAISSDKDLAAVLDPLVRRFGALIATRYLDNPRAVDPHKIAAEARRLLADDPRTAVTVATSPEGAFARGRELAGPGGAVVFAGSLLLAAEARRLVVAERGGPLREPG